VIVTDEQPAPPAEPDDRPARAGRPVELIIVSAGWVVAVLAAVLSGLLELFLTPLRLAGVPIGLSILMALVANPAIAWFAVSTTGRRGAMSAPWIMWTVLMLLATGYRRPEGDYLVLGNDWVALVTVLVGSLAFAVFAYRMILKRPPPI